jgi:hypothetical protein
VTRRSPVEAGEGGVFKQNPQLSIKPLGKENNTKEGKRQKKSAKSMVSWQ